MSQRKTCKIFIQDLGIFPDEILVMVGIKNLTKDRLKKMKIKSWAIQPILSEKWEDAIFIQFEHENEHVFCMWLPEYQPGLNFAIDLLHETHHAVYYILLKYREVDEPEALAYTQEYLFTNILKKLKV